MKITRNDQDRAASCRNCSFLGRASVAFYAASRVWCEDDNAAIRILTCDRRNRELASLQLRIYRQQRWVHCPTLQNKSLVTAFIHSFLEENRVAANIRISRSLHAVHRDVHP